MPSPLFLQLTHIHEVVLRGFPVGLAQVKLDRVLASKSPVAQPALMHGPASLLVGRRRWGVGQGKGDGKGGGQRVAGGTEVGQQFFG